MAGRRDLVDSVSTRRRSALAAFDVCRVLLFDKAGLGLSDPVPKVRTLDDRVTEIEAVMDAVGFEKAAVSV